MGKTYRGKERDFHVKKAQRREVDMREKTFESASNYKRQPKHKHRSYDDTQKG